MYIFFKFNPSVSVSALMTLIYFTLSNARRFYSSMGSPSDTEGLRTEQTHKKDEDVYPGIKLAISAQKG